MIDYFAANLWQLWTLIAIICMILELTNGDFFIMCFSIGALIAAISAAIGFGFYANLLVFAVFSVLCLFFVRPMALKYLHKSEDARQSNADALIGRIGKVSQTIEACGSGRVAIDGDDWKAESVNGAHVSKGQKVKVVSRESIVLIVEPEVITPKSE